MPTLKQAMKVHIALHFLKRLADAGDHDAECAGDDDVADEDTPLACSGTNTARPP